MTTEWKIGDRVKFRSKKDKRCRHGELTNVSSDSGIMGSVRVQSDKSRFTPGDMWFIGRSRRMIRRDD